MKIGIFGGSFDPPHIGHVLGVSYALSVGEFDKVFVIPTYIHPHGKELQPYEKRVDMAERAFQYIYDVRVSTVEREIGGKSLTCNTVEYLMRTYSDISLIVGSDVARDIKAGKWEGFEKIVDKVGIFVLGRAGIADKSFLPEISSTELREKIKGRKWGELSKLIPASVLRYISDNVLYL